MILSPSGRRVMRSEVWNNFDLEGLTAVCRVCKERLKVGPTRQTSSLWRHWKRHAHQMLLNYKSNGTPSPDGNTTSCSSQQQYINTPQSLPTKFDQQYNSGVPVLNNSATTQYTPLQSRDYRSVNGTGEMPQLRREVMPPMPAQLQQVKHQLQQELKPMVSVQISQQQQQINYHHMPQQQPKMPAAPSVSMNSSGTNGTLKKREAFAKLVIEFLLENRIPFASPLIRSPSFHRLLAFGTTQQVFEIPHPSVLNETLPKMHLELLETFKQNFGNDFFALILKRTPLEGENSKYIVRVSAAKIDDNFSLFTQSLATVVCDSVNELLEKFRHHLCNVLRLESWQVCAIVHDGSAEFAEISRQMNIPEIPALTSIMQTIQSGFDKLDLGMDAVQNCRDRLNQFMKNDLVNINPTSLATTIPILVKRIDAFFDSFPASIKNAKFAQFWLSQRAELIGDRLIQRCVFLNPHWCFKSDLYTESEWTQMANRTVDEFLDSPQFALLDDFGDDMGDEIGGGMYAMRQQQREQLEAEVSNYVAASLLLDVTTAQQNPSAASSSAHDFSPEDLLLWWRQNSEKFPRVSQLARQYLAIPLRTDGRNGIDRQNMQYAIQLLRNDTEMTAEKLAQMLTLRTSVFERTEQIKNTLSNVIKRETC